MSNEWKKATWTYSPVGLSHTYVNFMNALETFLTGAGWTKASGYSTSTDRYFYRTDYASRDIWRYTGDGYSQKCGIYIHGSSGQVIIRAYVENTTNDNYYKRSHTDHQIVINLDETKDNNLLLLGGEDGLYFELGTGTSNNNVAHGAVVTFQCDPNFNYSRQTERQWISQGVCLDLFGQLKFARDRNWRFCEAQGSYKNHTGTLSPYVCRGSRQFRSNSQVDDMRLGIGPRDHMLSPATNENGAWTQAMSAYWFTFGLAWDSLDDVYRISPMACANAGLWYDADQQNAFGAVANNGSESTLNLQGSQSYCTVLDSREIMKIPKFAVISSQVLPWNNVTDPVTSVTYRVAQVTDNNRNSIIGIQWSTDTVSIPATP